MRVPCLPNVGAAGSVRGMAEDPNDDRETDSRAPAVIGLVVVAVLVVVGYFLVDALRENSKLQDCLMSGRTNCAPLDIGPPK
jgi:hypothetical protein